MTIERDGELALPGEFSTFSDTVGRCHVPPACHHRKYFVRSGVDDDGASVA